MSPIAVEIQEIRAPGGSDILNRTLQSFRETRNITNTNKKMDKNLVEQPKKIYMMSNHHRSERRVMDHEVHRNTEISPVTLTDGRGTDRNPEIMRSAEA